MRSPGKNVWVTLLHFQCLTHWGRVRQIWVSKLTIIGSDNGSLLSRCQSIIWTSFGLLSMRTLGTNLSKIWSEIHIFFFKKMHLKMSSGNWGPFYLGFNVSTHNNIQQWNQWIATHRLMMDGRAVSRFGISQWEMALLCHDVSHCLDVSLWSAPIWH